MGTKLGTKVSSNKNFRKLWEIFYKEVQTNKKFTPKTLHGFSKYYIEENPHIETTAKNLKRKLERWEERVGTNNNFQNNTYLELEEYYKFINKSYFKHELLEDEDIEHWFD